MPAASVRLTGAKPATVIAVVLVALLARWNSGLWRWDFYDLAVYRRGGAAVAHGHSLYAVTSGLPFTYPPFAAILFVPMHAIGQAGAAVVITLLSAASYVVISVSLGRGLGFSGRLLATLCIAGLALEPVLRTLRLGQVNLILVALVVADIFLLPNKMRGIATGIAAGIKLTPGIFLLYFLLKRDWHSALRCTAGFAITIGLSAAITGDNTKLYWTKLFYNPDHIGGVAYVDNQSLYGVLVRLSHNQHPPLAISSALALAAVALASLAAHRRLAANEQVAAVTCIGIGGLLASPISWSHHWIWLIGALLVLIERGQWRWAIALGLIGYLAPQWFTPYGGLREFRQVWWQIGLCNLIAGSGLVFLLLMLGPLRVQSANLNAQEA